MTSEGRRSQKPVVRTTETSSLGRVGVIALLGFIIGIVWPRLAGVSLVPEAPVDEPRVQLADEDEEHKKVDAEPEVIELSPEDRLGFGPPTITSCVDSAGNKKSSCGALAIDDVVHPHLISLLGCPAASGVFGTLSLGFQVDFKESRVSDVDSGKSTNLPGAVAKELLRCAEKEFESMDLSRIPHDHPIYQVYYLLDFKTPEVAAEEKTAVTPASGQATVRWGTALIRKEPEQDASVQARLLSGARVLVTGRKGEWYRIKYDAKGREGWVHGNALGLGTKD